MKHTTWDIFFSNDVNHDARGKAFQVVLQSPIILITLFQYFIQIGFNDRVVLLLWINTVQVFQVVRQRKLHWV